MDKDLIIGGASNYDWDQLRNWVRSIKTTDYTGDIALVITNVTKETLDKLTEEGVTTFAYGRPDGNGGFEAHTNGAPHVERFFYIWNSIRNLKGYRNLIVTDTRDVIFQKNPSEYIDQVGGGIICASEGLLYKDEPWGSKNFLETFGPFFHEMHKEKLIYNVGTIGGDFELVRDLMLMIFQSSVNRPIPIVDQAVFNFLIDYAPFSFHTHKAENKDFWAAQLGTTIHAVKAGAGDIGASIAANPSLLIQYQMKYKDEQPIITEEGLVTNAEGEPFYIVHQYDRVFELKDKINKRYEVQ